MKRKRRKIDHRSVCKNLIDIEQPLWTDVFTIIFLYLTDNDICKMLTLSKTMLEIIKRSAAFRTRQLFLEEVDLTWKKFEMFYFSFIEIGNSVKFIGDCEDLPLPILRQKFLTTLCVDSANGGDMRLFCKRNGCGNLIFPNLKKVDLLNGSVDSFHFVDFLRAFPFRVSFTHRPSKAEYRWSKETIAELVKYGKFDEIRLPNLNSHVSEEGLLPLKDLDARTFVIDARTVEVPKWADQNENVTKIVIKTTWFHHFTDGFIRDLCDENKWKNVEVLEFADFWFNKSVRSGDRSMVEYVTGYCVKKDLRLRKIFISGTAGFARHGFLSHKQEKEVKEFCKKDGKWKYEVLYSYGFNGRFFDVLTIYR